LTKINTQVTFGTGTSHRFYAKNLKGDNISGQTNIKKNG